MEYQHETIRVRVFRPEESMTHDWPTMLAYAEIEEREAMVGIGSGLAYHRLIGAEEELYTLTMLTTDGYQLGNELFAENEQEARLWLEKVAKMTDWTQQPLVILTSLRVTYGDKDAIRAAIDGLLEEAGKEVAQQ